MRLEFNKRPKKSFKTLIESKFEAFQLSEDDVGLTDLIEHEINTVEHPPIKQRPYRIPATVASEVERYYRRNSKPLAISNDDCEAENTCR